MSDDFENERVFHMHTLFPDNELLCIALKEGGFITVMSTGDSDKFVIHKNGRSDTQDLIGVCQMLVEYVGVKEAKIVKNLMLKKGLQSALDLTQKHFEEHIKPKLL